MIVTLRAIVIGLIVVAAGTIPRNLIFAANLRDAPGLPWAAPVTALYVWLLWRYLRGAGPPRETSRTRRAGLRANAVPGRIWRWALLAGGLAIVTLVLALRVANRLIALPPQQFPNLHDVPRTTVLALLLVAAPVAAVVEEAAFRGYMQGPLERRYGLPIAILITGTIFAAVHMDFTPVLWPYYVAVAVIYSSITHLADSIRPAIVLHTAGNLFSNVDLWLHGRAEWQSGGAPPIFDSGIDATFLVDLAALVIAAVAMTWAYSRLVREARPPKIETRSYVLA